MIQWAIVVVYVVAMFLFASREVSSASHMSKLLNTWLPHLSIVEIKQLVVIARKVGHVLAYGILTLIVYYAAKKTEKLRRGALPFAVVFAVLVALVDEGYQSRLYYRTGTMNDVFIDAVGISVVALILWVRKRRKKEYKEVVRDVKDKS